MYQKTLVSTATRYIAGRNAVQTVYWKTTDAPNSKMWKVSKTFSFGSKGREAIPSKVQGESNVRFN